MPLLRQRAFVLSCVPLKERDRIVTVLTQEEGNRRLVARGARRLRSAFSGSLEPMTEVEVLAFEREGSDLHRLDALELLRSSFSLTSDLRTGLLLSAFAESLITFVPDSDPSEKFFRLARHVMDALFSGVAPGLVATYFDAWVLRLSGVLPGVSGIEPPLFFDESLPGFVGAGSARPGAKRLSRSASEGIAAILTAPLGSREISDRALSEIADVLASCRRQFLGHELKSHRVLARLRP